MNNSSSSIDEAKVVEAKAGVDGGEGEVQTKNRKRKKARGEKWDIYIHNISLFVQAARPVPADGRKPKVTMTRQSMKILGAVVNHIFARFSEELRRLRESARKQTLTENDVLTAAKFVMNPGGIICQNAVANAKRALEQFKASNPPAEKNKKEKKEKKAADPNAVKKKSKKPKMAKAPVMKKRPTTISKKRTAKKKDAAVVAAV